MRRYRTYGWCQERSHKQPCVDRDGLLCRLWECLKKYDKWSLQRCAANVIGLCKCTASKCMQNRDLPNPVGSTKIRHCSRVIGHYFSSIIQSYLNTFADRFAASWIQFLLPRYFAILDCEAILAAPPLRTYVKGSGITRIIDLCRRVTLLYVQRRCY